MTGAFDGHVAPVTGAASGLGASAAAIAALVAFLLSDEASFITGQTVTADGGLASIVGVTD